MNRNQRRGASRINRDRRSFEIQVVRYSCRRYGVTVTGDRRRQNPISRQKRHIFVRRNSEIYATFLVAQSRGGIAGILKRFVTLLQEQTVLRIHVLRFMRRDSEEQRIETIDVVQRP